MKRPGKKNMAVVWDELGGRDVRWRKKLREGLRTTGSKKMVERFSMNFQPSR